MRLIFIILIASVFVGCNSSVKPIEYGVDACYYCDMTVVENQYGAELVTDKGKVRTFDAIECLVRYIRKNPQLKFDHLVVNVFDQPGKLLNAKHCTYLISRTMPSPMGAYLTAFSTNEKALEMQKKKMGDLYSWDDILVTEKF